MNAISVLQLQKFCDFVMGRKKNINPVILKIRYENDNSIVPPVPYKRQKQFQIISGTYKKQNCFITNLQQKNYIQMDLQSHT